MIYLVRLWRQPISEPQNRYVQIFKNNLCMIINKLFFFGRGREVLSPENFLGDNGFCASYHSICINSFISICRKIATIRVQLVFVRPLVSQVINQEIKRTSPKKERKKEDRDNRKKGPNVNYYCVFPTVFGDPCDVIRSIKAVIAIKCIGHHNFNKTHQDYPLIQQD